MLLQGILFPPGLQLSMPSSYPSLAVNQQHTVYITVHSIIHDLPYFITWQLSSNSSLSLLNPIYVTPDIPVKKNNFVYNYFYQSNFSYVSKPYQGHHLMSNSSSAYQSEKVFFPAVSLFYHQSSLLQNEQLHHFKYYNVTYADMLDHQHPICLDHSLLPSLQTHHLQFHKSPTSDILPYPW